MEGIGSAGQPKLAGALKKRPRKRGDPLKKEPAKKPKKEPRSPASIDDHAQGDATVCDCNSLVGRTVFKNFSTACKHYGFPGSHQVGSYGPKGTGIVRTYSNATPGKDIVLDNGEAFLYRLKDEKVRAQFKVRRRTQGQPYTGSTVSAPRYACTAPPDRSTLALNGLLIVANRNTYQRIVAHLPSLCGLPSTAVSTRCEPRQHPLHRRANNDATAFE